MLNRTLGWWQGLSGRERGLIGFLGVLLTGVVIWYGAVTPLAHARDAAGNRRLAAEQRLERLKATVAAHQAIKTPANVRQAMEQAARQVDVHPQLGMGDVGFLSFSLERTPRASGSGWLAGLEKQGVEVTVLRIEPHDDGTLSLRGSVRSPS